MVRKDAATGSVVVAPGTDHPALFCRTLYAGEREGGRQRERERERERETNREESENNAFTYMIKMDYKLNIHDYKIIPLQNLQL